MNRPTRSIAALTLVAVVAISAFGQSPATASPAPRSDASNDTPQAVARLSSCIRHSQQLATVILMDQSKSLRSTDKQGRRTQLGAALIDALSAASGFQIEGKANQVDLLLVGFGSNVNNVAGHRPAATDWQTLDRNSLPTIDAQLAAFAQRNGDDDTDYVDALSQSMQLLAAHTNAMSADHPEEVCKLVLWFTDGKFDLSMSAQRRWWAQNIALNSGENLGTAIKTGLDLLCSKDGVANELRRQSTFLFTFALTGPKFTGADEQLLRHVTLGSDGCGSTDGASLGWYSGGSDLDVLRQCVVKVFTGLPCGPNPAAVQCHKGIPCEFSFPVDETVAGIAGYAIAQPPAGTLELRLPNGKRVALTDRRTEATIDGAQIRLEGSAGTFRLDANLDNSTTLSGQWTVSWLPTADGTLDSQVVTRSTYSLKVTAPPTVVDGHSATLSLQLTGRGGQDVGTTHLRQPPQIAIAATQGTQALNVQIGQFDAAGNASATFTTATGADISQIDLIATGSAQLADGKTIDLGEQRTSVRVLYPGLGQAPEKIVLGALAAARSQHRAPDHSQPVLPITQTGIIATFVGPAMGAGTACLDEQQWDGAIGSSSHLAFASGQKCIALPQGTTVKAPLTLNVATPLAGHLTGALKFTLTNSSTNKSRQVSVAALGDILVAPPDPWTDSRVVWLLLILALALPVALFIALTFMAARLPSVDAVRAYRIPTRLTRGALLAAPDFRTQGRFPAATSPWRAQLDQVALRSPIRYFRMNQVIVTPAVDAAIAEGSEGSHDQSSAVIAHGLGGQWFFVADRNTSSGHELQGDMYVMIGSEHSGVQRKGSVHPAQAIIDRASRELPSRFDEISQRLGTNTPGATSTDFNSGFPGYGPKGS